MPKRNILLLCCILFTMLFFSTAALAENYALLIGVSRYPYLQGSDLEGPEEDVAALQRCLQENLGFKKENITVLKNSGAEKGEILFQIVQLKEKSSRGDLLFIYFSGHGTSRKDSHHDWSMSLNTGAIVPVDYREEGTVEQKMEHLIVGRTDLQPLLKGDGLEKDRRVVVIFDSCYSGQAVRSPLVTGKHSIRTIGTFDSGDLVSEEPAVLHINKTSSAVSPYQNIIYISAAGAAEPAMDIDSWERKKGKKTIDNKSHGAFTNLLLHAFMYKYQSGVSQGFVSPADDNCDGLLTAGEIHQYIRRELLHRNFSQEPCLLTPEKGKDNTLTGGKEWNDVPLFTLPAKGPRLTGVSEIIPLAGRNLSTSERQKLQSIAGVQLLPTDSRRGAELIVNVEKGGYGVYHPSGKLLVRLATADALQSRIARQPLIKELEALADLPKKYGVMAEIIGSSGVYVTGMDMGVKLQVEEDSYVLLLDIAPSGRINIIWPYETPELRKIPNISYPGLTTLTGKDIGTESLVALAFNEKPSFWNNVLNEAEAGPNDDFLRQVIAAAHELHFAGASVDFTEVVEKGDLRQ